MSGPAPDGPGLAPTWTSSAKDLVSTAVEGASRIWLTLGHGIGNEIYWPSTGQPQIRDLGFIVTARETWIEVKRTDSSSLSTPAPSVLVPTVVHCGEGWELRLTWIVDPDRDVVMVDYELTGDADGLYVLVAPHLGSGAVTNTAWVDHELHAVADGADAALCLSAVPILGRASAGYVGFSDGWQDFHAHGSMQWEYERAAQGNVAMMGELARRGTLAVGFALTPEGATVLARTSLAVGADVIRQRCEDGWRRFTATLDTSGVDPQWRAMVERSAAVLACHEDRTYPGASVASLSVPWGDRRTDLGGYHLVWARDGVECALGRLAAGDRAAAERTLRWLCATQQPDGHWTQNAYPDGRPFWTGVQLDEVALPVVLAAALGVGAGDPAVRRMVAAAARYLVHHGPSSPQDRWEENAGTNAFTLATIVAALVLATRWLDEEEGSYCLALADYWNERVEDWLYVAGGELAAGHGVDGYYVRMGRDDAPVEACGRVDVRNRVDTEVRPDGLVACDFLALVRFGLRRPDDPRVVASVRLIDAMLAVDLPTGVAYRRYNGDGYGEHEDGTPFDGTGTGRPWPLLAGERGHYAAQAGGDATRYLASMTAMSGRGGLLPEQVWDGPPIPERFLEPGRPSGSAMPLAWAHAEFVKLATLARRGQPVELRPEVGDRYLAGRTAHRWFWRLDAPFSVVPSGRDVAVDHPSPFVLRVGETELASRPCAMGRHAVTIEGVRRPVAAAMVDDSGGVIGRVAIDAR